MGSFMKPCLTQPIILSEMNLVYFRNRPSFVLLSLSIRCHVPMRTGHSSVLSKACLRPETGSKTC
uniref:Putative ovule protein n=1 Tax=Solanum chacoense TaxID=4108 RepID=A0A0V0HWW0_SOLCH